MKKCSWCALQRVFEVLNAEAWNVEKNLPMHINVVKMKKLSLITAFLVAGIAATVIYSSCETSAKVSTKIGAQLWGENCQRCHNTPDPADYSDPQWEAIGVHMKLRANSMSDEEIKKVIEFMKSAN
jgi:cytochrome c5